MNELQKATLEAIKDKVFNEKKHLNEDFKIGLAEDIESIENLVSLDYDNLKLLAKVIGVEVEVLEIIKNNRFELSKIFKSK